jgi:hypothetical protein
MKSLFIITLLLVIGLINAQEVIDISVKGLSDTKKDGKQKDRMEAIMDAKRQACEKAGLKLESKTKVENFQTTYDYVESKSEAVLLPGFRIMDIGYTKDDTYAVVLVGQLRTKVPVASEFALFHLIVYFQEKKKPLKKVPILLDKLYEFLSIAHGEFMLGGKQLDEYEDNLVSITKRDSAMYSDRKFFAFTYRLPAGKLYYKQETPTTRGGSSDYDFKIKLRPDMKYIMPVAHHNAIYFNRPKSFDATYESARNAYVYPKDFKPVYTKR